LKLFPSPVIPPPLELNGFLLATQNILALEPSTGSIEFLTAQYRQDPLVDGQFTCNPPVIPPTTGFTKGQSFDLGQGNFTPLYTQLVADGSVLLIVAKNIPAVLLFKVSDGTTTSIPLHGGSLPLAASASTDGSQVYIAASDPCGAGGVTCPAGSVHIVNTGIGNFTTGQGDFQQVAFYNINDANNPNMCNNQGTNAPLCLPDLVAIKPQ
jgi:hypothetical protein